METHSSSPMILVVMVVMKDFLMTPTPMSMMMMMMIDVMLSRWTMIQ